MTNTTDLRYPNLVFLRMAHSDLLRAVAREGANAHREHIMKFLQDGAATGVVLDSPADREVAQGLLDYWKATLYTSMRERLMRGQMEEGSEAPSRLAPAVLADFDETAAHQLANAAELTVAGTGIKLPRPPEPGLAKGAETIPSQLMPPGARPSDSASAPEKAISVVPAEDQDLVRRVLLQMTQFNADKNRFVACPVKRAEVESGADAARLHPIVEALLRSGALRTSPAPDGTEQVELASESLMRHWPRLAKWLEQRRSVHDAARIWNETGRDRGTLLSGAPLQEAMSFPNLDPMEREFVEASTALEREAHEKELAAREKELAQTKQYAQSLGRRATFAYALAGVAVTFLGISLYLAYSASRSAAFAKKEKLDADEARTKAEKALAREQEERRLREDADLMRDATFRLIAEAPLLAQEQSIERAGASNTWGLWTPGRTLHVRFLEGSVELQNRVREAAKEWERHASVTFVWTGMPNPPKKLSRRSVLPPDGSAEAGPLQPGAGWFRDSLGIWPYRSLVHPNPLHFEGEEPPFAKPAGGNRPREPEIRISFTTNLGIWSYRGTDALSVPPEEPTMNLEGLSLQMPRAEFDHLVLHCFGIALGLVSELQVPNAAEQVDWTRYLALSNVSTEPSQNWSRDLIERRFKPYSLERLPWYTRPVDFRSVMIPPFAAVRPLGLPMVQRKLRELGIPLKSGQRYPFTSIPEFSNSDKSVIAQLYPKIPIPVSVNAGVATALAKGTPQGFRHVVRFKFHVADEKSYIEMYLRNLPTPGRVTVRNVANPDQESGTVFNESEANRWVRFLLVKGDYYLDVMSLHVGMPNPAPITVTITSESKKAN